VPKPKYTTPEDIDKQFGVLGPMVQMFNKHFPPGVSSTVVPTPSIGPMQQEVLDRITLNVKRMVDYGDGDTAMVRDLRSLLAQVEWLSAKLVEQDALLAFTQGERDGYKRQLAKIRRAIVEG
jgi:hypothetical protein